MRGYQVDSDGRTVWVNSSTGMCIGRFSVNGIDVHHDYDVQMETGKECLDCKPGPTDLADWRRFEAGMEKHYGVKIAKRHMPKFLRAGGV